MLAGFAVNALRGRGENSGQILDVGRLAHDESDHPAVRRRTIRAIGTVVGLVLEIWLVGFHIALPTFVAFYLWYWGKVVWWAAILIALTFLGILIGLYDNVMHVQWHISVLDMLLGRGNGG